MQPHLKMLDAGASKEAPFVLEADRSSNSPEEAQPYVYPPHLDACRTHGDEFDVDVRRDDRDRRLLGPLLQAAPGAPLSLRSLP